MTITGKKLSRSILWMVLLLSAVYAFWVMRDAAARVRQAQSQEYECMQLANQIRQLKDRPGFAALGVDSPRTITERAEAASQTANLPAEALLRIEPQEAVRLRDSSYRLRPTRLELRRVTLTQLIAFAHAMIDESQGTTIRDLRLTAVNPPAGSDNATGVDLWTAELVLTQLIFSPIGR